MTKAKPGTSRGEPRLRQLVVAAAALSAAGALTAGTVSRDAGAALVLVGWGAFVYALHRFGRLGR